MILINFLKEIIKNFPDDVVKVNITKTKDGVILEVMVAPDNVLSFDDKEIEKQLKEACPGHSLKIEVKAYSGDYSIEAPRYVGPDRTANDYFNPIP